MKKDFTVAVAFGLSIAVLVITVYVAKPKKNQERGVAGLYVYEPVSTSKPPYIHKIELASNGKYNSSCGNGFKSSGTWGLVKGEIGILTLSKYQDCSGQSWDAAIYSYDVSCQCIVINADDGYVLNRR